MTVVTGAVIAVYWDWDAPDAARVASNPVTISGNADTPLSPGSSSPIDVEFTNPHLTSFVVTSLAVSLEDISTKPSRTACDPSNFRISQMPPGLSVVLPALSTVSLADLGILANDWPQVGMIDSPVSQDDCKSRTLRLGFTAEGRSGGE